MKTKNKLSWNDIVFEFKNKDYGAYFLRKVYNKDITIAASISLLVLLLLVGPPFIMAKLNKTVDNNFNKETTAEFFKIKSSDPLPPPPPPPPLPPAPTIKEIAKFVVVDTAKIDIDILTIDQMLDSTKIENVKDPEIVYVEKKDIVETPPEVPTNIQEMPTFPGGEIEMQKFIVTNFVYPKISKEIDIQGKVYISFIVNEDGSLTGIRIERGLDEYIDKEARRVIEMMPDWNPGRQNGNPAKVRIYIPIVCTLVN
jgi:periplasmic protein TonB